MTLNITGSSSSANGAGTAVNTVNRAISDLRRGVPIVLDAGSRSLLILAAESGGDPELLRRLTGETPVLLITATRAEAIGGDANGGLVVSIAPNMDLTIESVAALIGEESENGNGAPVPHGRLSDAKEPEKRFAVDLVKLARLLPAALIVPLPDSAVRFARQHDLLTVATDDIAGYRDATVALLPSEISARIPLQENEDTRLVAFRPADGGKAHLAIVIGDPNPQSSILVRLHSECFTGDLLGSLRCDCGDQLRGAIAAISAAGGGILLYLAQEGRGIGLSNKLRAYRLQDDGFDTIEANEALGFGADERVYAPAAEILRRLGYKKIRLMTNNPEKVSALADHGIEITARIPHAFPSNGHNEQYLRTKAARGGHLF